MQFLTDHDLAGEIGALMAAFLPRAVHLHVMAIRVSDSPTPLMLPLLPCFQMYAIFNSRLSEW
jgi:hypothetical protein